MGCFSVQSHLFEQDRLKTNILQYPIASRSFEKCKQFAWRVSYSLDRGFGGTTFNKAPAIYQESEIWTFKTACVNSEESAKRINSEPVTPIYFKTSLTNAGNYHEISNSSTLRFVVDNPYRELPNLSYIIVDERGTEINLNAEFYNEIIPHDLPDLPLTEFYGENKFIVELPSSIELNKPYVLIINGLKENNFSDLFEYKMKSKLIYYSWLFSLILIISSCKQRTLSAEEYIQYCNNPENKLIVQEVTDSFEYFLQYRSPEFMAIMEMGKSVNQFKLTSLINEYQGLEYYTLKIKNKNATSLEKLI